MDLIKTIKKLVLPGETDRRVDSINAESKAMLEDAAERARRHNEVMKKNKFSFNIFVGTGGNDRGH